jgi:Asp-tRNA(Asn)/Glu-tRNA(Gln) amidotransferase A subunit family amidase
LEDNIPAHDEASVKRLKAAGIVLLGKTNTPAFGYKGVTDNLIFGATKNPWNLECTSGGSSGGAASSIASGLGVLALGSDGGGSIRLPSCFCGVYGLKPTFGRVAHPTMKLAGNLGTLVHKGPIVRYVKDAALMLDVIAGADDSDRYSLPKPTFSYFEKLNEKPKKLKIGYSLDLGFVKAVEPEVKESVLNAVQKFERLDWTVEKGKIRIKDPSGLLTMLWTTSFRQILKPFPNDVKAKLDPGLQFSAYIGRRYSVSDLKAGEVQREMMFERVCKFFKKYDVLVTPTLACPAFKLEKDIMGPNMIDGKKINPTIDWLPFTYPFNLTGHPAASIPCGWTKDGLPIGMQIVGRRFDELTVLQASKAFEELQPWQEKRPVFN